MKDIIKMFDEDETKFEKEEVLEAKKKEVEINDCLLEYIKDFSENLERYKDTECPLSVIYSNYLLRKFKEKVKEFLNVIDFDLCVIDEKGISIHDKHNEKSLNYVLNFPIDFKSDDNMRFFRCYRSNKDYTLEVWNSGIQPFIKNGIGDFELSWRNGIFSSEEDAFSARIVHQGSSYYSFIGRISDSDINQVVYKKWNRKESICVLYRIDSTKREFEITFREFETNFREFEITLKPERRIFIQEPIENKSQKTILYVEEDKQEVYRQELNAGEIKDYMHSLFYKAENITLEIHDRIRTLDSTIYDKVFDRYDVAKEYMNIRYNSKASNDVINELFKKYFDSDEFKMTDTWIETMNKVATSLTPIESMRFMAENEPFIQEQMKKIANQEHQTETALMEEDENYDSENWSMILGNYHNKCLSQTIKENFKDKGLKDDSVFKSPTKVLKRKDNRK